MAYTDFSLENVVEDFDLSLDRLPLFPELNLISVSAWLEDFLSQSFDLAIASGTEKARSEFIVAPILLEMRRRHPESFSIFSGKSLEVDKEKGLWGECDFILSKGKLLNIIQTPIFTIVEAKKQDMEKGLGQCAAQLVAAQIFNQRRDKAIDNIFGCVTTGQNWQFLKLTDHTLSIDTLTYFTNELDKVLSVFETILQTILNSHSEPHSQPT
jgi:hypothetical protein